MCWDLCKPKLLLEPKVQQLERELSWQGIALVPCSRLSSSKTAAFANDQILEAAIVTTC